MVFPDYHRLCGVAEECASLQYDYCFEQDYNAQYPIPGIPILLFPPNVHGLFLIEIIDRRKGILEEANQGNSMAFLEHKELSKYVSVARRALCELDEIRHTLVYQSIHLQIQLNLFQTGNARQIYFPGPSIHDIPPVNIRFRVDLNWSHVEYVEHMLEFHEANLKYFLLIDAYKFTYDTTRIARAIQLCSADSHPFDAFFLAPRYIQIFRAFLTAEIAKWLRLHHHYWSVISP